MVRKDERQCPSIADRIRFFSHKGKEILLVDLSNYARRSRANYPEGSRLRQRLGLVVRSCCSRTSRAHRLTGTPFGR